MPGDHKIDALLGLARSLAAAVHDPEIPVVTLEDLGILRGVRRNDGCVVVSLTPTYAGCPAMQTMCDDVAIALNTAGIAHRVEIVLSPAWSTDWISTSAREKLRQYGIAPPNGGKYRTLNATDNAQQATAKNPKINDIKWFTQAALIESQDTPACPQCASPNVEKLAEFASTACKSLWRCLSCREPFDYFKPY